MREVLIDKEAYLLDDDSMTYRFLRRDPEWKTLLPGQNLENELSIEGYTRIFRDGRRRVFRYEQGTSSSRRRRNMSVC